MTQDSRLNESRVPPQATEVEENMLGGIMSDAEVMDQVETILQPDDFYKPENRHIYESMLRLRKKGTGPNLLKVEQDLKDRDLLDVVGGTGYLADISRGWVSPEDVDYYAGIIKEKSVKRQGILLGNELIKACYDTTTDIFTIMDKFGPEFDKITLPGGNEGKRLSELMPGTLRQIEERYQNPRAINGVPTGLDVDTYTAGWQPGELIIIAGRPSMGKTALMITVANNAASYTDEELRKGGLIISKEMSKEVLMERFIGVRGSVSQIHLRSGKINKEEFENIKNKTAKEIEALNIWIDDSPDNHWQAVAQSIRKHVKKHNIGWVMIDYLQLLYSDYRNENRNNELGYIANEMKSVAKKYNIPVIPLSQLSRGVEMRNNKRPQLSDLRDSGEIEQAADVVCFLYRPEYYGITKDEDTGESTEGIAEIIVAKQRNGPLGTAKQMFQKEYGRFVNMEYRSQWRQQLNEQKAKGKSETANGSRHSELDSESPDIDLNHDEDAPF